ncbi:MAG: tol-pal system protein YbgF [Gammaproteobacteria bacterium CG_4_10_14_0_8_um_filter_38_16]|nr:MAG: tol-pal system protein YbgF [Gammaproteobacteria bacterium CG_4_10_14_0_8_um_filter_38_16]PJA03647.1 MAG: tol-pal system protein YbgF [Gammaproteobacteria bacterium CG_4_10_14_0_2_um_filter_38_22]PJB11313.1 MAG: tol-pal system protein YbgF [Gammaproteobacteria bacterium CG_4_9_14_3_um_filter_38_9]
MKVRLRMTALGLALSFSSIIFAHEAPVVDVQQNAVSTQPEDVSSSGWQTVSNDDNAPQPATSAQNTAPEQQWASAASQQPAAQSVENTEAPPPSGSVDQRVSRLEQQMANYNQMNLPQQVSDMQQRISQLQGQVELDQRELKILTTQQKTYYQDIEQQITQLQNKQSTKTGNAADTDTVADDTTTNAMSAVKATTADNSADMPASAKIKKESVLGDASSAAPSLGETNAYGKAFRLLSQKHFNQAKTSFSNYLKDYPQGRFAVNAYFWLGEISLMNQHYNVALNQFDTVVKKYPHSNKVSDAKLKIAMIHAAKGQTDLAKKEFVQIRKDYPSSTAAQLASIRLQQISGGMTS